MNAAWQKLFFVDKRLYTSARRHAYIRVRPRPVPVLWSPLQEVPMSLPGYKTSEKISALSPPVSRKGHVEMTLWLIKQQRERWEQSRDVNEQVEPIQASTS